ncbi:GNAT family N-acetyltransferase [Yinghuangia seranimata]|uniref:GNAT family N-acetyltransferase n=1 Tax=Yinghuangia seranimata TaxID=408067 RepID=UPI00248B2B19|nr:GNAT family N-acetyltransferase [Yinghuangia seranimata]MDI2129297.1 GNAT family N-acetyltransferase [Yinghuangia seranimata]
MTATASLTVPATAELPELTLRAWRREDAPALIEAYRDPVLRTTLRHVPETDEDALRWLDVQWRGWDSGNRYSLAVFEPDDGPAGPRLVANVVVKNVATRGSMGEVGYWTAGHSRGRGVAPRAVEALTAWAFAEFDLEALDLLHQIDNTASCRVAEKAGYVFDEVLPALPPEFPLDGHRHIRLAPR